MKKETIIKIGAVAANTVVITVMFHDIVQDFSPQAFGDGVADFSGQISGRFINTSSSASAEAELVWQITPIASIEDAA